MIGTSILHFKILEKLGEGGMGVVYKAHDTKLDRTVALKFLPHYLTSDPNEKERFYHEARAAAALTHTNIAVVYEIGEHENQLFIAMEYVEGKTLKQLLETESLSLRRVLETGIQICEGLAAAHEKGIVHRDIKSDNIIVTPKGQPKITDFGLAKVKGATKLTKTGSTLGTAAYMSPEQAQGEEVDHRSDIFSLGVVLYELLTGRLPFKGEHQAALIYSIISDEPQPIARFNEKVTPETERIVSKAMEKERDDRYQHVDDLLSDLRRERKKLEYAKAGYATTTSAPLPTVKKNHRVLRIGITIAALLVLILAALIFNPFNLQIGLQKNIAMQKQSLAVINFENIPDPSDKDYAGEMLSNLLTTALFQAKNLDVISRERLYEIQKELGQAESKTISIPLATQIARRAGVSEMLMGSILQLQPSLTVTYRVVDVQTGKILSTQRLSGYRSERMFALVDTLAILVNNDLKITPSAELEAKPVASLSTGSIEAYRAYMQGIEADKKFMTDEAVSAYRRAVEIDSTFAPAYLGLFRSGEGRPYLEKAVRYSGNLPERDRLLIEAEQQGAAGSDVKAINTLETLLQKYPHEQRVYDRLAMYYEGNFKNAEAFHTIQRGLQIDSLDKNLWNTLAYYYAGMGQKKEAIEAVNQYLKLAPAEANPYDSQGEIYALFGDMDVASASFQKATTFRAEPLNTRYKLGWLSLLKCNYAKAAEWTMSQTASDTGAIDYRNWWLRRIPMMRGQLNLIRKQTEQLLQKRFEFWASMDLQVVSYEMKENALLLEQAKTVASKGDSTERYTLAWAEMVNGNQSAAFKILEEVRQAVLKREEASWGARLDYMQGMLFFEARKYEEAVTSFRKAFQRGFPNRYPDYPYALSLLKAGRIEEAINEFQRVTVDYGFWGTHTFFFLFYYPFPSRFYLPIAEAKVHYWLGVAYETQRKSDLAVKELQTFLEIWKDADFKSPEIEDARVRLAKLKGVSAK